MKAMIAWYVRPWIRFSTTNNIVRIKMATTVACPLGKLRPKALISVTGRATSNAFFKMSTDTSPPVIAPSSNSPSALFLYIVSKTYKQTVATESTIGLNTALIYSIDILISWL